MKVKCIRDLVYYNENDDKMKFENGKVYEAQDMEYFMRICLNENPYYRADLSKSWFDDYFETVVNT